MLRRLILSLLKIAAVVLVVCALLLYWLQDGMIYYPRAYEERDLARFRGRGGVPLEFATAAGKQVAYYLPPEQSPDTTPESLWLLCGGNGALALDYLEVAERAGRGQGYLFVDYPNYGQCEGKPTPASTAAGVEGAVAALARYLGAPEAEVKKRFSAFGHSLGGAVVLRAAAEMGMRRAVVVSPFTSLMDFARGRFGFPLCQVLRHRYDNRPSLRRIEAEGGKVVVFHGSADAEVPVENGRTLAAEFPLTVDYREIAGGDHNGIVDEIAGLIASEMRPVGAAGSEED